MLVYKLSVLSALSARAFAIADPLITPAAQLAPRATDSLLVGYITTDGGYSDVRSCDYTATVSTSGGYFQCCPTSGSCIFYTACSSNTLLAAGTAVPCDVNPTLTCNTALVLPTAGAQNGASYLACWQKSLGNNEFTFVQNTGGATGAASTGSSSGSSSRSSSGATTSSASSSSSSSSTRTTTVHLGSSSRSTVVSSTSSTGNPAVRAADVGSGAAGIVALLAQMLL